jgi:hypothetical protein
MSKNKTWTPPGWPWELDLLTLAFLVIGVLIPYNLFTQNIADSSLAANQAAVKLKEQTYILWSIGLCLLYIMHLALSGAGDDALSIPVVQMVSPALFASLAYYRILTVATDMQQTTMLTGHPGQILVFLVVVMLITFIVARLRLARHLHRFRDTQWDLECAARYDSSYFSLMAEFRPLVYPPRRYRVCDQGLLIEGWCYSVVIPFTSIQSVHAVRASAVTAAGYYYTSNTSNLVRLELVDSPRPLFISPEGRDELVQYIAHYTAHMRPSQQHRSRHGTHPGVTARDTHAALHERDTQAGLRPPQR